MTDSAVRDTAYRRRLDDRVTTLATSPGATLRSVLRDARGAFPTLVDQRLRRRELVDALPEGDPVSVDTPDVAGTPELHPLDFEWYFTGDTANAIAETLRERGEPVLCLGAPTVAVRLARRGVSVTLVDRSKPLAERLPVDSEALRFVRGDVREPLSLEEAFPVAFFDPPWYPEHTEAWLYRACRHVRPGGRIHFVLFPPLVRPGAAEQRRALLETARRVGPVSIDDDAVTYCTPAFERTVLRTGDVPVVEDWRRADLVSVDVTDPNALSEPSAVVRADGDEDGDWETFVVNEQVVKVRVDPSGEPTAPLAPVEKCNGYVLPSVSRRDARRRDVDLWTSRNRVARVGDGAAVVEALRLLESGTALSGLPAAEFTTPISADRKRELTTQLATVLE